MVTATSPSSSRSTRAPMARSTLAIVSTSLMRGTLESTVRPSASRQPAISLSAEFFAPPALTVPRSGPLGSTTIWSALESTSPSIAAGRRPGREPRRADQLWSVPVVTSRQAPDRNLAMDLVRTTEAAAMAASRWMGRGDKIGADGAAVEAMRTVLSSVPMDGIVVIGEGEKDNAPMLFNGEKIGDGTPPAHRHRGRPDRRHHAHGAGPRRRAGGHRRGRARRHVRPRAVRLHGEAGRRARGPRAPATSAARRPRTSTRSPRPWAGRCGTSRR